MKKISSLVSRSRTLVLLCFMFVLSFAIKAQTQDTLHVNYDNIKILPHDTALAKMDAWIKSLNGAHVDINVYAYYSKSEFRKYAQQRADEMFLILNRKARSQFTIVFIGPKKGENSQRSRVDIVYTRPLTEAEKAAVAAKEAETKAAEAKKKETEEAAKAEKAAKSKEKSKKPEPKGKEAEVAGAVAGAEAVKGGDKNKDAKAKGDKKDDKKGKGDAEDEDDEADYGQASSRTFSEGSSMTLEELKYIKSAKFVIAQTGRKALDTKLNNAVKDYWDFTSNIVQMPYDEAIKLGKENKKDTMVIFSFIQVRTWFNEKHGPVTLKILRVGYALSLENAKGKILVKQIIPKLKGQEPAYTHFVFGVSCLNDLCHIVDDNKLTKSTKSDEFIDLRTPDLKNKMLLLGESQINKNLPRNEIPSYYSAPYTIVSDKEVEDAILQKKDVAYAMVVLFPINPKHFFHYIMDAKTGKIIFLDLNSNFSFSGGFGTPSFDPTQSGFIDKSNFQRYDKGINNAIKDNAERAEDKAKDAEKAKKKADAEAEKKAKKEEEKKKKEEEKKKKEEEKK